uniref:uncharacterized protein LOC109953088 n=1 Tax=Monopterus albus TaxID=43700 RepID=UPI0009B4097E|nr:uncharacterized protein LOC109953088 [Monopterus albus]XP_020444131.1 uncharacterized protein LOC109953088 [Monopterus albus]XP_020444133.1 uncharacterized protein LOC109953088 [Monopterus albus]
MTHNLTANKSLIPCQLWVAQNDWSTTSTQGPPASSQHLCLGSSSDQSPSFNHLQASSQSCMSNLSTVSSRSNTQHSSLYTASHISSSVSSTALFTNTVIPSASHTISFAQQSPHMSSVLLTANQGKTIPSPSLPQQNKGPQLCNPQQFPLLLPNSPYKALFQPPFTNQGLSNGRQDLPTSLPSCGHRASTSQATFEGANMASAGFSGYTHSYASAISQEQPQWIPLSHCRGAADKSATDATAHANSEPSQEENITSPASIERRRSVLLYQRAQLLKQLAEMDNLLESVFPDENSDGPAPHTCSSLICSTSSEVQHFMQKYKPHNFSSPSMDDSFQRKRTKTRDAQQVQPSAEESESQSHLSVKYCSPLSCDEQDETWDMSEDSVSEGEPQNMEGAPVELEDESDPDYFPSTDDDISDFRSDSFGDSSDEFICSSPSTCGNKSPPVTGKKRATSKSSLYKVKSVHPRTTNKKKSSELVVLPSSNIKAHRVYDKRNYCMFCSQSQTKMARHFERVHSDKAEVAAALQYPKKSRERHKIWNKLINQGNFAHNKDVLRTGNGQLAVRKRPKQTGKAKDFLHCLFCRGLYGKKALYRHMRKCPEKVENGNESRVGRKSSALQCVLDTLGDIGVSDGFKTILYGMIYDDVTQAIIDDKIILQFGEQMFNQHGSDVKKHGYIRQNLRQIARLVLEAQNRTPLNNLEEFFYPSSFRHVVSAVNVLAGYDPESNTYSIPSLALKLGHHLQKACSIVEANAVKDGDAGLAESAREFLSVFQNKWNRLISSGASATLRETKLNTEKKVPFAQDVKCLSFHMENVHLLAEKKLRESPSAENYAALAKVVLARTIVFNRRKPREISSIQLINFMSRKKSNVLDNLDVSVSDLERSMCGFFTRVDVPGNCGRMVPVLLKPSFVSAMELLVNSRDTCGVPWDNPFVFGRPRALSAYRGSDCIQQYVKECGARNPEAMTLRKIRKHYTTMLQLMNLDKDEANQILVQTLQQNSDMQLDNAEMDPEGSKKKDRHKWEEAEVRAVERHMMRFIQERKVPQKNDCVYCIEAEPGALRNRSWRGVKDYVRNRITTLKRQSGSSQDSSTNSYTPWQVEQAHGAKTDTDMSASPSSVKSGKKVSQNKDRHKWEEAEVHAVERHMMCFIQEHKVPQKNDCVYCIEAEPGALRNRSWRGVKDYVRNRITTLKRQSSSSQDSSTKSYMVMQAEPQPSTGYFQQLS